MKSNIQYILFFCIAILAQAKAQQTDTLLLKKHLHFLVDSFGHRSYLHPQNLDKVADYIAAEMGQYADTVYRQFYEVRGARFQNVIAVFCKNKSKHIVVGAHYDTCGDLPGADDNASGVAGLLELARLLRGQDLAYRFELVAFSTEEPPYFWTQNMGSFVYAKSLRDAKTKVEGMISIEMIGYFDSKPNSQTYPFKALKSIYGNKGDFITLASNMQKGRFVRRFSRKFRATKYIRTRRFSAPSWLPITSLSDHRNFWLFGYSALMITDTAMWRNFAYHTKNDTIDRLNLKAMADVVNAIAKSFKNY